MKTKSYLLAIVLFVVPSNAIHIKCFKNNKNATQYGYHGPVSLGPLSIISSPLGAIAIHKLWLRLNRPLLPRTNIICYVNNASNVFLIVGRGDDDHSLVRSLAISKINICPHSKLYYASGFRHWKTDKNISLDSTETEVIKKYGQPTEVWKTHAGFTPYPTGNKPVRLADDEHILVYLARDNAPSLSYGSFGIRHGAVIWIMLSDNE